MSKHKKILASMKILLFTIGLLVVGYLGSLAATCIVSQGPRIELSSSMHDFGRVSPGQRLCGIFEINNSGDENLHIQSVITSCECTKTSLSSDVIAPGQKANLCVELTAARYGKPIEATILVVSNDPNRSRVPIYLKGTIISMIDVFPPNFTFGVLDTIDLPAERYVKVYTGALPIQMKDYQWIARTNNTDYLSASVQFEKSNKNEFIVKAKISKDAIPGPIYGTITLEGKKNGKVEISRVIACLGKILGPIAVVPDSIVWDKNRKDLANKVFLSFAKGKASDFELLLSKSIQDLVNAKLDTNDILVELTSKSDIVNLQQKAVQVSGVIWLLKKHTNIKILAIPVIILGK